VTCQHKINLSEHCPKCYPKVVSYQDLLEENKALKESRNELLFLAKILNDVCVVSDPRNDKIIQKAETLKEKNR